MFFHTQRFALILNSFIIVSTLPTLCVVTWVSSVTIHAWLDRSFHIRRSPSLVPTKLSQMNAHAQDDKGVILLTISSNSQCNNTVAEHCMHGAGGAHTAAPALCLKEMDMFDENAKTCFYLCVARWLGFCVAVGDLSYSMGDLSYSIRHFSYSELCHACS